MTTTALFLSPAGAQRVTVNGFTDAAGTPIDADLATHARVTDREGTTAVVARDLLTSFREA